MAVLSATEEAIQTETGFSKPSLTGFLIEAFYPALVTTLQEKLDLEEKARRWKREVQPAVMTLIEEAKTLLAQVMVLRQDWATPTVLEEQRAFTLHLHALLTTLGASLEGEGREVVEDRIRAVEAAQQGNNSETLRDAFLGADRRARCLYFLALGRWLA